MLTQTFHGPVQYGTGRDQLMLAQAPWHRDNILIRALSVTHRCWPHDPRAFVMVGSTGPDEDILAHTTGTQFVRLPELMSFGPVNPPESGNNHIDVHAFARCARHEVFLTIYYTGGGELMRFSDELPRLRKKNPAYAYQPPRLTWRERVGVAFGKSYLP